MGQGGRKRLLCSLASPHTSHEVWGWARSWGHLWALGCQEELAEAGEAHPHPTPPPPLCQTPTFGKPPWIQAEGDT